MTVSTGYMRAGMPMDMGMDEILMAALGLEACIYSVGEVDKEKRSRTDKYDSI